MALPDGFIDQLLDRVSLAAVVGKRVKLTRKGNRRLAGLCPFHSEKTPSFFVDEVKGLYHCFGCKAGGNAITFLQQTEGGDFMDAVRSLASMAGMTVPDSRPISQEEKKTRNITQEILDATAKFYGNCLRQGMGSQARNYLERRLVNQASQVAFGLGYAPKSGLVEYLTQLGYSTEAAIASGVVRKSDSDDSVYDYFRHRLMFPVRNVRGQVVGFGGRALADDQQPKYINSADSPLFRKRDLLYGLCESRDRFKTDQPCLIVEGYMDVIAIQQHTDMPAVAPLGTALTESQLKMLWKRDDCPYLCFDGDNAGQQAAHATLNRIIPHLQPGKNLRVVALPSGQDPDALLRGGDASAFKASLDKSLGFMDALWQVEASKYSLSDPIERAEFEEAMQQQVRLISNNTVRKNIKDDVDVRIARMHEDYGLVDDASGQHYSPYKKGWRGRIGKGRARVRPEDVQVKKNNKPQLILVTLIEHPQLIADFVEEISGLGFSDGVAVKAWQILEKNATMPGLDKTHLRPILQEAGIIQDNVNLLLDGVSDYQLDIHSKQIGNEEEARKRIGGLIADERRRIVSIRKRGVKHG